MLFFRFYFEPPAFLDDWSYKICRLWYPYEFQVELLSQDIMLSFLPLSLLPTVLVLATRPLSRCLHCRTFDESVSSLAAPASASSESHANCFPSLGFTTPSDVPSSTDDWWCSATTEYAFLGFSYEVTACTSIFFIVTNRNCNLTLSAGQSLQQLKKEFADMRNTFHSRYVRLYGACDREGFYDDVIEAAWCTSLGVHALIWVSLHATCIPISSLLVKASLASMAQFNGLLDATVCSERSTQTQKPCLSHAWSNLAPSHCMTKSCHPMILPSKCCPLRKIYRV